MTITLFGPKDGVLVRVLFDFRGEITSILLGYLLPKAQTISSILRDYNVTLFGFYFGFHGAKILQSPVVLYCVWVVQGCPDFTV